MMIFNLLNGHKYRKCEIADAKAMYHTTLLTFQGEYLFGGSKAKGSFTYYQYVPAKYFNF